MNLKLATSCLAFLGAFAPNVFGEVQTACPAGMAGRRLGRRLAGGAIISNGVVKLGVDDLGNLNIPGGGPSVSGETDVGVRFLPAGEGGDEYEATSQGCSCEGWGISAVVSGGSTVSGYANNAVGIGGLTLVSFVSDSQSATSVSSVNGGSMQVTHTFAPSSQTANLYEVKVSIENTSGGDLTDVRYRRNMDWDADPTPFSECVTIITGTSTAYEFANDNGFMDSDPQAAFGGTIFFDCPVGGCPADCSAGNCDSGSTDHGASFQFLLKESPAVMATGETLSFSIFYGGAPNKAAANSALGAVGAEVFSQGYSAQDGCSASASGAPATYVFGFAGVGGDVIIDPGTLPDPHFKTFGNVWYDFHGGCDLVLINIPNFAFGAGLSVNIRTTVRYAYSFIETAAIKIGNDILEVSGYGQHALNGISNIDMPAEISGHFANHTIISEHEHEFYIDLGDDRHFTVKVFKDMVSFSFHLHGSDEEFGETVGLLGHWKTGARLARDGTTVLSDPNEFGQEWQVLDTEPNLFMAVHGPQYPTKCVMPDPVERASRRLEASVSVEDAEMACDHIKQEDIRDMCVFDVISTSDISVAQSGVY